MKEVTITRDFYNDLGVLGKLTIDGVDLELHTLENPWLENRPRVSCIPEDVYRLHLDYYHRGGYPAYEVMDVPGRSEIKIHVGNYPKDTMGCPLLGLARDKNIPAVWSSRSAYSLFMNAMDGVKETVILITDGRP